MWLQQALLLCVLPLTAVGAENAALVNQACYFERGKHYRGQVSHTKNGKRCASWTDARLNLPAEQRRRFVDFLLKIDFSADHNRCRNPQAEFFGMPFCFTVKSFGAQIAVPEYCDIPSCKRAAAYTGVIDVLKSPCHSFPCQEDGKCIQLTSGYMCDCTGTGYTGSRCHIKENVDVATELPESIALSAATKRVVEFGGGAGSINGHQGTQVSKPKGDTCYSHLCKSNVSCITEAIKRGEAKLCKREKHCFIKKLTNRMGAYFTAGCSYGCDASQILRASDQQEETQRCCERSLCNHPEEPIMSRLRSDSTNLIGCTWVTLATAMVSTALARMRSVLW